MWEEHAQMGLTDDAYYDFEIDCIVVAGAFIGQYCWGLLKVHKR